ncbi:subtilisin-like protease [Phanerochaete sordida]|uniref:Subtilisin-like protease n=1 Tax=Phanerochaete sordida TaxID=48140 RepID=A0A9P3LFI9_9APHY|nr:subtilisin-like protease [Phanerochaete sordida]
MKSFAWSVLAAFALLASALAAKVPVSSLRNAKTPGNVVPNRFIIELSAPLGNTKRDGASRETHEVLYSQMRKRSVSFQVDREFNSPGLFVGASVTLKDANDRNEIASMPGVQAIHPVHLVAPPKPVVSHVVTGVNDAAVPADTESTHIITGVDKLHAQGITGKGIKVGIIDTGIDFTHPDLGGGIGPGFKIIGGFDFVGDAFNGSNTPVPDPSPLDQCNGHGTHVAGIIGANPGNAFNISGVAFDASLTSYRIFGCTGGTPTDIIVEALLRGVSDGQDILTMSLGGPDGWTEDSASVLSSRISDMGKIVTIAAGNDGADGMFFTSGPGNALDAISVASLDNTVIPLQNATVVGVQHDPVTYFDALPLPITQTLPIFATSTDTTVADDACDALPDSTPDLSKFIVIVRRGTCTFVQKLTNIAAKGGTVSLIYDNGSGFDDIDVGNFTSALIQADDGVFLVQQFAAGKNVSLSFPQSGASTQFPDPTGGLISTFTSYGPTNDMFFKPAVAAPGGNILSTFPVPLGSFAVLSGTSMATPFIAGVSALLFGLKGNSPAVGRGARDLFETTAQLVASSKTDGDPLQTVAQQGAGLVNAFQALTTNIIISPGELLTNDTANFVSLHNFKITNNGKTSESFKISHVPAGTALSLQTGTSFFNDGPVPLSTNFASIKFSETSLTVHPGQTQQITAHITAPTGVDPSLLPVFSGFIQVESATETFHVTYLGVASALKDAQVVDDTDAFFGVNLPVLTDPAGDFLTNATNFTFVGEDVPSLLMRLAFGTAQLRADLVDPSEKIATTLNKRGAPEELSFPSAAAGSAAAIKTVGSLFELDFQPRNTDENDGTEFNLFEFDTPTFANGSTIPNGSYKLLLRALKVTGDPTNEADFESWLSPVIGVQVPSS